MFFLKSSYTDKHSGILQVLFFIAGLATLIDTLNTLYFHPEYYDFLPYRIAMIVYCWLLVLMMYFSDFVKNHVFYFFYFLAFNIVIWLELCLYYNHLNINYTIIAFIVFSGIGFGFSNVLHYRIYTLFFLLSTFITLFSIENPQVPLNNVIMSLLLMSVLSLEVFERFIQLRKMLILQNANLKAIFDSIEESYFLIDTSFALLDYNKKAESLSAFLWDSRLRKGESFLSYLNKSIIGKNFKENFQKALKGESLSMEISCDHQGRTLHFLEKFLSVQADENHTLGVLFILSDITQQVQESEKQKKAEEEAKTSQSQLKTVFGSINLEIWTINPQFEYITFNELHQQRLLQLFQHSPIKGHHSLEMLPKELERLLQKGYDTALNGEQNIFEFKYKSPEGKECWLEYYVSPLVAEKQIIGALVTARDITLQKSTLDALRQSEYQFRNFFDFAPISMAIVSIQGEILNINQAFSKTFGYEHEDLRTRKFADFSHSEDIELNIALSIKLLKNELEFYELEKRYYHKNGELIYAIIRVSLIKDTHEKPLQFLVQLVDITERKLNEAKIEDSERLLKSINQNLNDAIYRSTPENGIVYVNQAFVNLFGYQSIEEILAMPASSLYANPVDRDEIQRRITQFGSFKNEEILFRRKDGSTFWGLMSGNATNENDLDDVIVYDGAITDITDLKKAEERLQRSRSTLKQRNQQLIKINNELDQFVYITGHDLKAPLASILGLINVMRLDLPEMLENNYLQMMEKSIHKLDAFIQEIIDYSKNARLEIINEKINFSKLIEETFEEIQFFEEAEHIEKIILVDENEDFYTDKKRLTMILNNLFSNAIRYHDKHKKNPFVKVHVTIFKSEAFVEIEDNGIGIEQAHIGKIFDMFYRASDYSSGSGLGLYIVKEAVKVLKGEIKVSSVLGQGTKFKIRFPNRSSNS